MAINSNYDYHKLEFIHQQKLQALRQLQAKGLSHTAAYQQLARGTISPRPPIPPIQMQPGIRLTTTQAAYITEKWSGGILSFDETAFYEEPNKFDKKTEKAFNKLRKKVVSDLGY